MIGSPNVSAGFWIIVNSIRGAHFPIIRGCARGWDLPNWVQGSVEFWKTAAQDSQAASDCELAGKLDGFAVIHGWSVENAGRGLTMAHRYVS